MRLGMDFKKWAITNVKAFDPTTQQLIESGEKNFRAQLRTYYSKIQISNLGAKTKLVNDQQTKSVGITDLETGKLKGTDNLLLMFIGLGYDTHPTEVSIINRRFSNSLFNYSDGSVRVPAEVRNTIFNLEIGGDVKLTVPTDHFFVENKEKLHITGDYRNKVSIVDNPILIRPEVAIMPYLESNDQAAFAGTAKHFICTELTGLVIEKA